MKGFPIPILLLSALVLCGTPRLEASPRIGTTQKKPPRDHPEILPLLADLDSIVKDRKGKRDAAGVTILDKLGALYPTLNRKQKKSVVKGMIKVFKANRKADSVKLLLASGEALSKLGKDGAEALAQVLDSMRKQRKHKKDWLELNSLLVRYLGRPAEPGKYMDMLLDLARRSKDDLIRAAAGEALGHYKKHKQDVRKEIVEKLIKELSAIYNNSKSNVDPRDSQRKTYEDRYATIQTPWMNTLTKLTGQKHRNPVGWLKWFNKNKRKNWDKLGYGAATPPPAAKK